MGGPGQLGGLCPVVLTCCRSAQRSSVHVSLAARNPRREFPFLHQERLLREDTCALEMACCAGLSRFCWGSRDWLLVRHPLRPIWPAIVGVGAGMSIATTTRGIISTATTAIRITILTGTARATTMDR